MRKDRYITNDEVADIDCLTAFEWTISQKNQLSVRWAWPRNGGIRLAAVFIAETAEDTLEMLLERQLPVIVTKDIDKDFTRALDAPWRIYRVFPAHFGEGSDVVILNQQTGNVTAAIARVLTVQYKLEYRALPLSEYRRVNLTVQCEGALPSARALICAKYRNSTRICEYPLDAEGTYMSYIKKNETLDLYVSAEYGNIYLTPITS